MERTGNDFVRQALRLLHRVAQRLALQATLVFMRTWLARVGWVVLAVSSIIWLLSPDAMQKWSDRSVFRKGAKGAKGKVFESEFEELAELEGAFAQMVGR